MQHFKKIRVPVPYDEAMWIHKSVRYGVEDAPPFEVVLGSSGDAWIVSYPNGVEWLRERYRLRNG